MSSAASDPFDSVEGPIDVRPIDGGPDGGPIDDGPLDEGPVFGERRRRILRLTVLVALGAMVLPLVLSAFSVARSAAERACAIYVSDFDADATASRVAFDLFAQGGPGWLCYDVRGQGGDAYLGNLGPMPALPRTTLPGQRDT